MMRLNGFALALMLTVAACTYADGIANQTKTDLNNTLEDDGDQKRTTRDEAAIRTTDRDAMDEDVEERLLSYLPTRMKSFFRKNSGVTTISEHNGAFGKILQTNPSVRKSVEKLQSNGALMKSLERNPVTTKLRATLQNKPVKLTPKNIENIGRAAAKEGSFKFPHLRWNYFLLGIAILAPLSLIFLIKPETHAPYNYSNNTTDS
ncbi:hypothetical protein L914_12976 [Phytophthora nicotianae]|nr:hypothetical protein L914_12976 [Phytophthora nicotianae]